MLCSGVTQAIALLAVGLHDPGRSLAMEDPGFWPHRMVLRHNGIDASTSSRRGWPGRQRVAATGRGSSAGDPGLSADGVVLPPPVARRGWTGRGPDHLIIEDDYDAEYRYDRAPVGALAGIAPDRVVYLGSTSKTLAPDSGSAGWCCRPTVGPVALAKGSADTGSSVMDQIAFAQLLASGGYDRHLRQMRRRYLARRNALLHALTGYLPQATVPGAAAGVHLTVRFPPGYPIDELVRRAAARGESGSSRWRRVTPIEPPRRRV